MVMIETAMNGAASAIRRNFPAVIYACSFSVWKKSIVRKFFAASKVIFVSNASQVPAGSSMLVWGRKGIPGKVASGVQLIHLEDGFLRSVGLGADLVRPISWVIDRQGIYYDATQPSDLEVLLQQVEFPSELLLRACRLRERIVTAGLTKYNVGDKEWQRPPQAAQVILVPGQVESDASIQYGAREMCTNLELLKAVRAANPLAFVLYKPHPDVVAGLRRQGKEEAHTEKWCDAVVVGVDMGNLLRQVDEVHTLTSLTGFEALLREKKVVCYGQPFYSGWGLTRDVLRMERRTRKLSLDELVAGSLILYPVYMDYSTGQLTTPECAMDELLALRGENKNALPWWNNIYRFLVGEILRRP